VRTLLLKLILTLFVITAVMMGLRYLGDSVAWNPLRSPRFLTDPALDKLAAPEPEELKGLAARITPFIDVFAAAEVAKTAGYLCELPTGDALLRLRQFTGNQTIYCAEGDEGFKEGRRALLLHAWYPRGFVRGVELKRISREAVEHRELLSSAPSIAVGKGVEFPSVASFADFIADRFTQRRYHDLCFDEIVDPSTQLSCTHWRSERARDGLPRWNGQPVSAGRHEDVTRVLAQTGFECTPPRMESSDNAAGRDTYIVRCQAHTFSDQRLDVALQINALDSRPQALLVELGAERQVLPLAGKPAFDSPGTASIIVQLADDEVKTVPLPSALNDGAGSFLIREFTRLTDDSQRRVVTVLLAQMSEAVEPPGDGIALPLLQRLDVAAHLLARFGVSAVRQAEEQSLKPPPDTEGALANRDRPSSAGSAELSIPAFAALALARCRVAAEQSDCLAPFIAARPVLRGTLISAVDEVRAEIDTLPESNPARDRLARLDRQIAASRR